MSELIEKQKFLLERSVKELLSMWMGEVVAKNGDKMREK